MEARAMLREGGFCRSIRRNEKAAWRVAPSNGPETLNLRGRKDTPKTQENAKATARGFQ